MNHSQDKIRARNNVFESAKGYFFAITMLAMVLILSAVLMVGGLLTGIFVSKMEAMNAQMEQINNQQEVVEIYLNNIKSSFEQKLKLQERCEYE